MLAISVFLIFQVRTYKQRLIIHSLRLIVSFEQKVQFVRVHPTQNLTLQRWQIVRKYLDTFKFKKWKKHRFSEERNLTPQLSMTDISELQLQDNEMDNEHEHENEQSRSVSQTKDSTIKQKDSSTSKLILLNQDQFYQTINEDLSKYESAYKI